MGKYVWQSIKNNYCERVGYEVSLDAQIAVPDDFLADQPLRINAHRCSDAAQCNMKDTASCIWAGTNPLYDPFTEKS